MKKLMAAAFVLAVVLAAALAMPAGAEGVHRTINVQTPGQTIDINKYIVRGKINIFDFYSKFCPPCMRISPFLEKLAKTHNDVVVSKIDINRPDIQGIDWASPVARQYSLESIPHFVVVEADGKRLEGEAANTRVIDMLKALPK